MVRANFTIDPETRYRAASSVLIKSSDGETVLLEQSSEEFFGLTDVGAWIFGRLSNPQSINDLIRDVVSKYAVDVDVARQDVIKFMRHLRNQKLIEAVGPTESQPYGL